jgi:hypothetical protein
LVKSGIINCVSIGFDPIDGTPLDPKRPYAGKRYTEWELLECSFVSVPADTGAIVSARENEREAMTTEQRESRVAVLKRGLYEVSDLACLLAAAGYLQSWIEMEAEFEGDGSDIPARFAAVLKDLGAVLVDMTAEEVAEMFAADEGERNKRILARAKARAGKRLSKATIAKMEETITHHQRGIDCMRDYMEEMARDDDEMAHEAASTRVAAAGLLVDVPAVLVVETPKITEEQRAASAERLRKMRREGALTRFYAEAAD